MSPPPAAAARLLRARFGQAPGGVWFAPGRANLMGEHTDYNAGFVLPFALGQGVAAAAARRPGRRLVLTSAREPGPPVEVDLGQLAPGRVTGWAAYPVGVAWALAAAGYDVPGAWLAFESDLLAGAGLSSSAALECATALALTELARAGLAPAEPAQAEPPADRRELAALASRAENDFAGGAVRPDGPVRVAAGPGAACAAAGLSDAGGQPGPVRPGGGGDPGAADRHQGPARAGRGPVRPAAGRMRAGRPAARRPVPE